ncbi:MAG TPA: F0F1 ATP synthase subunit delta [Opitutaceae bacterium]|nr:F0F1 ATP synthase subunit delta [Opitutaceae bacterium]
MAAHSKSAQHLARQLFRLSFEQDALSAERVGGVLAWVEKHRPANPVIVLKAYRRLVEAEVARSRALVEHAGAVSEDILGAIGAALNRKYGRNIGLSAQANPALLAGLRVRVGDDVYESSVSGQLAALAASV